MELNQREYNFYCPYCNAAVSLILDPSVSQEEIIENCEICSNPIKVSYVARNGEIIDFNAEMIDM